MNDRRGIARLGAVCVLVLASSASCAANEANGSSRSLPGWSGHRAELFDDAIDAAAVGLDFDKGYNPKTDAMLRERAQVGDAVLRVRVATVTAKNEGPDSNYQLGLHTVEKMAGGHPPPSDFTVEINKSSESHGIMKNFESRLVGYAFVAFVHEFVRADGERDVHFHLAPDTKEVKLAVSDALALGELK